MVSTPWSHERRFLSFPTIAVDPEEVADASRFLSRSHAWTQAERSVWLRWDTGPLERSERTCPYLAEHACVEKDGHTSRPWIQPAAQSTVTGGAVLGSHLFEGWPLAVSGILKNTDNR